MNEDDRSQFLSQAYHECVDAFGKFLLSLDANDRPAAVLEAARNRNISDEYGRLKIWGSQARAELPPRARGSLDDTLRHDEELRSLVGGILSRLKGLLVQATAALGVAEAAPELNVTPGHGQAEDFDSNSSISEESFSDLDSNPGLELAARETRFPTDPRSSMIQRLIRQISEQIVSLYDLSALLRRPRVTNKYISSTSSKNTQRHSGGSDSLRFSEGCQAWDVEHMSEKVLQWRGLTKAGRAERFEEEECVTTERLGAKRGSNEVDWFILRLARANTRRREQLRYWVDHPYAPGDTPEPTETLVKGGAKHPDIRSTERPVPPTTKPTDLVSTSEGTKTTVSKQSFSTAAISAVHDTKTNTRPRTVYEPTAIGHRISNSVPNPPASTGSTFKCPYCAMTLESDLASDRQSWK
ncbi:hypothetical protein OQA88_4288 [Cercophora sp. LCS_1]